MMPKSKAKGERGTMVSEGKRVGKVASVTAERKGPFSISMTVKFWAR